MAKEFKIVGNSFIVRDTTSDIIEIDEPSKDIYFDNTALNNDFIVITQKDFYKSIDVPITKKISLSNSVNKDGTTFTSITFRNFMNLNTGSTGKDISLPLTSFTDLRTAELHAQFQASFEYTVTNTELNSIVVTGSGTVTQGEAMAVIGTGTTTGSTACLTSKRHARYKSGLGGVTRFTMSSTTIVAGTEYFAGLADEMGSSARFKNGYILGFDGTDFGYHRFQNDVKFTTSLDNWDDPLDGTGRSGITLIKENLNIFFIQFGYLGAEPIKIWYKTFDDKLILVHIDKYPNNNTVPSVFNPNFFFTIYTQNGATTSNVVLKCSSYSYFVEGKTEFIELHQPQFDSEEITKSNVTTEIPLMTLRNKLTYASKTNFIDVVLELVHMSIEANSANNLGSVRLVRDATIGGTSFSDINTTDSVMEIDTAGTTVEGGKTLFSFPLAGKNDKEILDILKYKMILAPNEKITITGKSVNSATMKCGLLWKELF